MTRNEGIRLTALPRNKRDLQESVIPAEMRMVAVPNSTLQAYWIERLYAIDGDGAEFAGGYRDETSNAFRVVTLTPTLADAQNEYANNGDIYDQEPWDEPDPNRMIAQYEIVRLNGRPVEIA